MRDRIDDEEEAAIVGEKFKDLLRRSKGKHSVAHRVAEQCSANA